jgi:hypothetical protein
MRDTARATMDAQRMTSHRGDPEGGHIVQDTQTRGNGSGVQSPVDNATYNLIKALGEKLEAIEAYRKYQQDGGPGAEIFQQLAQEDSQHAEQLLDALRQQLGNR